jgi:hypothetical protein
MAQTHVTAHHRAQIDLALKVGADIVVLCGPGEPCYAREVKRVNKAEAKTLLIEGMSVAAMEELRDYTRRQSTTPHMSTIIRTDDLPKA